MSSVSSKKEKKTDSRIKTAGEKATRADSLTFIKRILIESKTAHTAPPVPEEVSAEQPL